jgi:hypothetical protein
MDPLKAGSCTENMGAQFLSRIRPGKLPVGRFGNVHLAGIGKKFRDVFGGAGGSKRIFRSVFGYLFGKAFKPGADPVRLAFVQQQEKKGGSRQAQPKDDNYAGFYHIKNPQVNTGNKNARKGLFVMAAAPGF